MRILNFELFKESAKYSISDVKKVSSESNIDISKYDINEIMMGIDIELEHGTRSNYNVTNDDLLSTLKILLAHLDENPKYYSKLRSSGIE